MEKSLSCYRVYTSNLTPIENLPYANLKEMHIVLAFARDYRGYISTKGKFEAFFDTTTLNPDAINGIRGKARCNNDIKFFLSIGGRKQDFPFALDPNEEVTSWVANAVISLKKIVKKYHLDGIDVYYENIKSDAECVFAVAISQVISTLKNDKVISEASITVSASFRDIYPELFPKIGEIFDYVVYQTHSDAHLISDSKDLVRILNELPYPKNKTLVGHSDARPDWAKVPPPIFLGAIPQILDQGFLGLSQWMVTAADPNPEN